MSFGWIGSAWYYHSFYRMGLVCFVGMIRLRFSSVSSIVRGAELSWLRLSYSNSNFFNIQIWINQLTIKTFNNSSVEFHKQKNKVKINISHQRWFKSAQVKQSDAWDEIESQEVDFKCPIHQCPPKSCTWPVFFWPYDALSGTLSCFCGLSNTHSFWLYRNSQVSSHYRITIKSMTHFKAPKFWPFLIFTWWQFFILITMFLGRYLFADYWSMPWSAGSLMVFLNFSPSNLLYHSYRSSYHVSLVNCKSVLPAFL